MVTAREREGQRKRERVIPSSKWAWHFSEANISILVYQKIEEVVDVPGVSALVALLAPETSIGPGSCVAEAMAEGLLLTESGVLGGIYFHKIL